MKNLKLGIVGLGRVSSRTHIPVLNTLENARIVSGAEVNPDRAKRVASLFSLERTYSSYEEMYENEELDGVYVCLPNHLHEDACRKALEAGIHVLCEKPMGISVKESQGLEDLASERRLVLMPGYKKRYAANFNRARRIIESGLLGRINHVQGTFLTPGPYISWDPKSEWYLDPKWKGVIYDVGCHIVDLLLYLVPAGVKTVRSVALKGFTGYDTPTNFCCACEMEGGILASLTVGWRMSTDIITLGVHGTAGSLFVSRDELDYLNPGTDPVDRFLGKVSGAYGEVRGIFNKVKKKVSGKNFYEEDLLQAKAFCDAITGQAPPPVTARDATNVHRFLEMIDEGAAPARTKMSS